MAAVEGRQYGGFTLKKPFKQEGLLYFQTNLDLLEEACTAFVYSRFIMKRRTGAGMKRQAGIMS